MKKSQLAEIAACILISPHISDTLAIIICLMYLCIGAFYICRNE